MKHIVCHVETLGPKMMALCTRCHKGLIAYNKLHGISTFKKHVEQDHITLCKSYIKKVHVLHPRNLLARELVLSSRMLPLVPSSDLSSSSNPFSKNHEMQKGFLEDIMLFLVKGFLPLKTIESI
jgi:hypothetical protein